MPTKKHDTDQVKPSGDNVDQIREILFGSHIRAVDERFETVEARLSRESDELRKTLENRILELEKLLGQFREDADDQLSHEGAERDAGIAMLTESLAAFRLDAENRLAALQAEFSAEIKRVREQLAAEKKTLAGEVGSLQAAQTERSDRLNDSKVDRGELAGLLSDIAGRLAPTSTKRSK